MKKTIEVPAELYEAARELAHAQGVALPELIGRMLGKRRGRRRQRRVRRASGSGGELHEWREELL